MEEQVMIATCDSTKRRLEDNEVAVDGSYYRELRDAAFKVPNLERDKQRLERELETWKQRAVLVEDPQQLVLGQPAQKASEYKRPAKRVRHQQDEAP